MLDQNVNETLRRIPGIGDIPILGYLFRSQAYTKNATELVVMITPHIVRRNSPGVTPNLPAPVVPFLGAPDRQLPVPAPAFTDPVVQAAARAGFTRDERFSRGAGTAGSGHRSIDRAGVSRTSGPGHARACGACGTCGVGGASGSRRGCSGRRDAEAR